MIPVFGSLSPERLTPSLGELSARLALPRNVFPDGFPALLDGLRRASAPAYVFGELSLADPAAWAEQTMGSLALARNLRGASRVFLLAVTLGFGVDRRITALSHQSAADAFLSDGIASALAEAAADEAERAIADAHPGLRLFPRFSPGYGDLPLSAQKEVLSLLDARRYLGITLTESLLMSPLKSVTAIVGTAERSPS